MASLAAIARDIIFTTLAQKALDKLIDKALDKLWDYLSNDQPSSSEEASKLQQLRNEWEALKVANETLKTMQSEARGLLKKDEQNVRVVNFLKKLNDVGYEIQDLVSDLESDLENMELQQKVEKIELAEADMSQSRDESPKLQLDDSMIYRIRGLIEKINNMEIYDPSRKNHQNKNKHETTSPTNEGKIYGRKDETKKLIRLLLEEPNVSGKISVVPILGMGGIGKTTLAQFAFNHPKIEKYFDNKVWVFVSDHFDKLRITKEIAESLFADASPNFPYNTANLNLLESELGRCLTGKKSFLLVLDDVWSYKWQQLLAPLRRTNVKAIKIIVTSRDPRVLAGRELRDRIILRGLQGDEYRSFFMDCVFQNDNHDDYSLALQNIEGQIMNKLEGSPLAVKTVGRLLGRNLTEEHWKHVLDSDLWEIGSDANDIMSALKLTYYDLPEHLQLCFVFCSVFPKGHEIYKYELIRMWIAHDYIRKSRTNWKTLEDMGEEYLEELNQRSLIEVVLPKVTTRWSSCKLHGLLHDLAQSVSQGEVYVYEGGRGRMIPSNVRHLCVCGPIEREPVSISDRLRTLVLYGDGMCSQVNLEVLKRIRVLVVIDRNVQEFPEAVTHLNHLKYLDFSKSSINWVPESLCRLYQLRVLRLPKLEALPSILDSFINLRSCRIAQLRNMNQLTGSLEIRGLENIKNKEEARKANLKEKGLIKYLRLCWEDSVRNGSTHGLQEEVFEGLQPPHNIKRLEIHGYMGFKSPSWLSTPTALQMLRRIELKKCRNWSCLPPSIGLLPSLEYLSLNEMENITIEGDDTAAEIFPSLKTLELIELESVSFERMSSSSSSPSTTQPGGRKLFPFLEKLIVRDCNGVNGLPCPMLSQLCRGLDTQLPGCLKDLKSLTRLKISLSECETLFDRVVMATLERLKEVTVENCDELISVDGLQVLQSLTSLTIDHCRKLKRWWVEESTSEQGVLLPKLSHLYIRNCQVLETLPACFPLLPSLELLEIKDCPKLCSLPEGGLPSSLRKLRINPGLMKCCQQVLSPHEWRMDSSPTPGPGEEQECIL